MASSKACRIHTSCTQLLSVKSNKVNSAAAVTFAKREKEGERDEVSEVTELNISGHGGSE